MNLKATIIALFILTGLMSSGTAACKLNLHPDNGPRYGADSAACVMNLSLYREFYKQWKQSKYKNTGSLNDALKSWRWVYSNCPKATENIYVDGVRMFGYKIKKEKEASLKQGLIDTLMLIYDQRIKYFPVHYKTKKPQVGKILGRKGVDYYKLDPAKNYLETYEILDDAIELDAENAKGPVYIYYFRSITKMAQKGDTDTTMVVDAYDMISDYVDDNLTKYEIAGKSKESEEWLNIKGNIENTFEPFANCTDLVRIYQKKYDANPEDIELLKKITKLLDKKDCIDSKLYFNATVSLHELAPSPESAYLIGKMMLMDQQYNEAVPYLEEAIKMENEARAYKALIFLAEDFSKLNQNVKARTIALKAAKLNPSAGKPYIIIGDLYAASANKCGDDELTKKVAYWAAVDKYKKARNVESVLAGSMAQRISRYQKYFPPTELLFFHNLNEGDSYKVECWINEVTKVRAAK
jgi:tetratricopeptide (TPR) repeat protein|tara:strand:- start:340 stop:1740 length:1401 start_codon:yes stop_codon:yes gene_type:complete